MTELEKLETEYNAFKEKMDARFAEVKRGGVDYATWWPERDGYYWVYSEVCRFYYGGEAKVHSRRYTGGIFATKEDRDTFVKVNERYYELMDGVVLDWGDIAQRKHEMFYDHTSDDINKSSYHRIQTQGVNYMTDDVYDTLCNEFTVPQLKLWLLGGARR